MRAGLLGALILLLSGTAEAGPWTREKGEAYIQTAVLAQRLNGQTGVRGELYGEYGLTPKWTLSLNLEGVTFPELNCFDQGAYRAPLRRQFWKRGAWRAAFEGGVVGGAAIGGTFGGCDSVGGEARVNFGGSGQRSNGREWYVFLDGVIREHGDCRRQRVEVGLGQEIIPNWFTVNKVFFEEGSGPARSVKVESVITRRFGRTDLSLGYRQEVGGLFQEAGVLFSIERRF